TLSVVPTPVFSLPLLHRRLLSFLSSLFAVFFLLLRLPPSSTLFPYTTLFRSGRRRNGCAAPRAAPVRCPGPAAARPPPLSVPRRHAGAGRVRGTPRTRPIPARATPGAARGSRAPGSAPGTRRTGCRDRSLRASSARRASTVRPAPRSASREPTSRPTSDGARPAPSGGSGRQGRQQRSELLGDDLRDGDRPVDREVRVVLDALGVHRARPCGQLGEQPP